MPRPPLLLLIVLGSACGPTKPPPTPPGPTAEELRPQREACAFGSGALPVDTLGSDVKLGAAMPFEHIILLMQENRSFDHYFSKLSHGGVRVAPELAANPDSNGVPHARFHETRYCIRDVNHGWDGSHRQFNDGANDGFVVTNEPDGARALGYFDETDLPYYYALARTFAISDAHFASLLGPTQPNRMYYLAATSFGLTKNSIPPVQDAQGRPTANIFKRLDQAGVDWKVYVTDVASPAIFIDLISADAAHFRPIAEFYADAASGNLPPVALVEPQWTDDTTSTMPAHTDEHPPANIQKGQRFTAKVLDALLASPAWPKTVAFLTYDEHGGFYDSVPPPPACEPDALLPNDKPGQRFDRYGFRVPLIAISPFARRGYVSHVVTDHTSVTRFVEARFGLKAMTARDANADALLDLFDFEHPDETVPALPQAVLDVAPEAQCQVDFP